jgi:hypothetical protein
MTLRKVERVEVLHCELALQGGDCALEEGDTGRHEHNFVDAAEVDAVVAVPKDEQGGLRLGLNEAEGDQIGGEATVPGP